MTTINPSKKICTLINVFTVEPDKSRELLAVLKKATEEVMCKQPGYISANLHLSEDNKTVTNYAQWASMDDFNHMQQKPDVQEHMKKAATLATAFKPVTYSEIWSHENQD